MESIPLFLAIVYFLYIVYWSIKNDAARSVRDQSGLLRMRPPADEKGADHSKQL